jgi:excisionase family DNA binding protein
MGARARQFMAQRFISLEDAAKQLSISKERLGQLREAGKVRAYRDGASWKFRGEDIDKLASDGIPQIDPGASDLALDLDEGGDLEDVAAIEEPATEPSPAASGLDLELADEAPVEGPAASDLSLEEEVDEPTVAGIDEDDSDAMAIDLDSDSISLSDSILLSEKELGGSIRRPPSTIIGKAELDLDADLDLSPTEPSAGPPSDVKLAPASDILPAGDDDDLGIDLPSPSGEFEGLPEVDIDLEAESSRILSPEDVAKVKGAMSSAVVAGTSDLELAPTDSDPGIATSDIGLGGSMASGIGLTGLSALELDDEDDEGVLGEGSDVTLSGESSGINIISPSDSGLALDEVKLDLSGGSAIGSSLDLGGSAIQDVTLEPLMVGEGLEAKAVEDFQLTPLGEEELEDEEKDSSQVIALEEISEEGAGVPLGRGVSEEGMIAEDFGAGVGLAPGMMPVGVAPAETPFSMWNVLGLASCLMLLGLCAMIAFDLLRNIWSWTGETTLNSSLLEVLNPFL